MTGNDVLFIHHSVGRGLLRNGEVRKRLRDIADGSTRLWDYDYNWRGLHGPNGRRAGGALPIPNNDTSPVGLQRLFRSTALTHLVTRRHGPFRAIVFKSCFPNSRIASDADLEALKQTYRDIAGALGGVGVISAVMTTPPVRAGRIPPDQARRAARLAFWLLSEHIFDLTFDLFGALADTDPDSLTYGMLRPGAANRIPIDSHPSVRASSGLGAPAAQFFHQVAVMARARARDGAA